MATVTLTLSVTGGYHATGENPLFELEQIPEAHLKVAQAALAEAAVDGAQMSSHVDMLIQLGAIEAPADDSADPVQDVLTQAQDLVDQYDDLKQQADEWEPTWVFFVQGKDTSGTLHVFTVEGGELAVATQALNDGVTVDVSYSTANGASSVSSLVATPSKAGTAIGKG